MTHEPEPLKGTMLKGWQTYPDNEYINVEDLKSAVCWLKKKMETHRRNNDLWRLPEDESWSMAEDWIDEAFEDVTK